MTREPLIVKRIVPKPLSESDLAWAAAGLRPVVDIALAEFKKQWAAARLTT